MDTLRMFCFLSLMAGLCTSTASASEFAPVQKSIFQGTPESTKVHAWWHWISGNITKEGITKDLESMNKQGVSQVTILNIGGFVSSKLPVPNIKFNTPEWYGMYQHALKEAKRLGMTVGAHNCGGWSTSGGPWITPENSMKEFVWSRSDVQGGQRISMKLPQPPTAKNYYEDVAVVAFPNVHSRNGYVKANPTVKKGKGSLKNMLSDGNPMTKTSFNENSSITVSFDAPYEADEVLILPHRVFAWSNIKTIPTTYVLSSSSDGKNYSKVETLELVGANIPHRVKITKTKAKYFKLTALKNKEKCSLAEFELLSGDEPSTYLTGVHGLLQKSVAVKTSDDNLYNPSTAGAQAPIPASTIIDITDSMSEHGVLNWTAPKGDWSIVRFGYTTTGMENKPATPEGTGLEIDKMDATAAKIHFDAFTGQLLEKAGPMAGDVFKFIMIDSWECHYQNWTHAFPEEFQARRGYDITRWIPVLCGEVVENAELSDGFLHDFRKTIADLIDQNYYKAMSELCHANNIELHAEAIYGGGNYPPLDILKSNGHFDLPMLEFWARHNDTRFQIYKPRTKPSETLSAFSALACDKPVIGSEAYTSRAYYSESPASLKRFGDEAFCAGVNQMILHSYVHQPIEKQPGVTLKQFGAHFNRNNPWWNHSSDWMTYQARAQYLLQKGLPVVDCIFFVGDQYPQARKYPILKELPFGFRANPCNLDMLKNQATIIDGKLSFGGMQQFALLALPERDSMELETLQILKKLVNDGLVLLGPAPTRMLGAVEISKEQEAFDKLVLELWGDDTKNATGDRKVGKGRVLWGRNVGDVLGNLDVTPDLASTTASPTDIMYIHKRTQNEDIYFVFNQTEKVVTTELQFRVTGKQPEIWQAQTGEIKEQPIYVVEGNQTRIPVTFKPSESFFVVFRNASEKPHVTKVTKGNENLFPEWERVSEAVPMAKYENGNIQFTSKTGGKYTFELNNGSKIEKNLAQPIEIDLGAGKTQLAFDPIYKAEIAAITMSPLKSITELDDKAKQYFAGTLNYTIRFELTKEQLKQAESAFIDFGKFDATAAVKLNGKPIGKIWTHYTALPVGALLQENNTLEVTLATTCRNRLIGDLREFGKIKTVFTTAPTVRNDMLRAEMPLKPTGLLGPVKLTLHTKEK